MDAYVTAYFMGGLVFGAICGIILTLAVATAMWLYNGEETKNADKKERQRRIHQINRGRIHYNDGLDIEEWLYR